MSRSTDGISRKEQILRALARMLEENPGGRITTAALAREVGVSEAALYRHFPSKARMFEGLIDFIEDTLFTRINGILNDEGDPASQAERILKLVLTFAEKNPGISRILNGDALSGETDRLRSRVGQVFKRLDTQLRQAFREGEIHHRIRPRIPNGAAAGLLTGLLEGKISQFVRSDFRRPPTQDWDEQWSCLQTALFAPLPSLS